MSTRLNVFTIVLNGNPWIAKVAQSLMASGMDWRWSIVHGVADPVGDTSWCQHVSAPEDDGTLGYLQHLALHDSRVTLTQRARWPGKTAMCNTALAEFKQAGILMQMDADEVWQPEQLRVMPSLFERHPEADAAMFLCRYWVGMRRYVCQPNAYGNNCAYEWVRAWRFQPGMQFETHEPPVMAGAKKYITQGATIQLGLVFDHYAYATRDQVRFKEQYYNYAGATAAWEELQLQDGPADISRFLPWVKTPCMSYEV